ncbi:cyclase family protein [Pendulispora albinea]|uniref:Cyclase family protein n=1 Tax=Pendulispora albinea TaxID=2741071 RepID=A0ABZ2LJ71_9BACT
MNPRILRITARLAIATTLGIAGATAAACAPAAPPASPDTAHGTSPAEGTVSNVPTTAANASGARPGGSEVVGKSPWGPNDEIGTLNMMTSESRAAILARADARKMYDLSTEYFVGMPSWYLLGDPRYQFWLTHTPRGTGVDDPVKVGPAQNDKVSYTGDAVSMYTHTGTHIDALNHFGLNGEVWNGFKADKELGDQGWRRTGVEKFPPIVARGVLIDVAKLKGVSVLPDSYGITTADLKAALARENVALNPGDVVMIRGGRMTNWPDGDKYVLNQPGLALDAAHWLAEDQRVMVIGGDNLSLEHFPVERKDNWIPVHTYLLAQRGIPIVEVVNLDELSRDRVYEFAFVAASLRFRGASAAPFRPIAFPLRRP